jgi:hypothetical protein
VHNLVLSCEFKSVPLKPILLMLSLLTYFFKMVSLCTFPHQTPRKYFSAAYSFHTPRPSHPPRFDQPHNMWPAVQILKPLIMRFSAMFYLYVLPHNGTTRCPMSCTVGILNYFCKLLMKFFFIFGRKSPYGIFSTQGSARTLFAYQKFLCVFIAGLEILWM